MELDIKQDLWSYLREQTKPVIIYGMGNGADKVINICEKNGIQICDFFASDAFVRGQSFHGKTVMTYAQINEKYGIGNYIVLLSFASSLPDVIENIKKIANEVELYAPDVPVAGENLFDLAFYEKYKNDFSTVYNMLADDTSKLAYKNIISYKLTGKIDYLLNCEHSRDDIFNSILSAQNYKIYADLGAYNGDTIRELIEYSPELKYVIAMEPDKKTFKKLDRYAETEEHCTIAALNCAAWSEAKTLTFECSGNRNSNVSHGQRTIDVEADSLDNILEGHSVDYIKYDVEGSEMEAILGCSKTIKKYSPELCISLYHRSEDLFLLPMLLNHINPNYKYYIRRGRYIPAWDINLLAIKK